MKLRRPIHQPQAETNRRNEEHHSESRLGSQQNSRESTSHFFIQATILETSRRSFKRSSHRKTFSKSCDCQRGSVPCFEMHEFEYSKYSPGHFQKNEFHAMSCNVFQIIDIISETFPNALDFAINSIY